MSSQATDALAYRRGLALREAASRRAEGWVESCLDAALEDPHPFPRSEGAIALSDAPNDEVLPRLARAIANDTQGSAVSHAARWRAERLLIRREPKAALQVVEAELGQKERSRRFRAAEVLGRLGPGAIELLKQLCTSEEAGLRRRAVKGLAIVAVPGAATAVVGLLDDEDRGVRLAALKALSRLSEHASLAREIEEARPNPLDLVSLDDVEIREAAIITSARIGQRLETMVSPQESIETISEIARGHGAGSAEATELLRSTAAGREVLFRLLSSENQDVAVRAAFALGRSDLGRIDEIDHGIEELVESSDSRLRLAAVRWLASAPSLPVARSLLQRAKKDEDSGVRWLAHRGLAGQLDARLIDLRRGRLPSDAPSARWPFGLPAPDPETPRRSRLPLAIATVNLSYNLNLGVLIRSAEAAGVREVLVAGRDFYHRLAAMGADRWLDLSFHETSAAMAAHARARGYQLVAVQQCPGAERFDKADYPPRPCLMLGSEGPGLSPEILSQADLVVEIPQRGEIDSINVATAASIVLWACLSQRGWI